jgi:hypothetical protein
VAKLISTPFVAASISLEVNRHTLFFRLAFFKQAFPFLDSATYVAMYFPFVATSPSLFQANDGNGANVVGTGSTLYNNDGSISAVGQLLLS